MNGTERITNEMLMQFCGSQTVTRHWTRRMVMTEGVMFLVEHGAAWLLDAIASYQPILAAFQVWELKVADDRSAVLECREDSDRPAIVRQEIEFTDFPLPSIKLYVCAGEHGPTAMLTGEY